jgi:hypothetical protein
MKFRSRALIALLEEEKKSAQLLIEKIGLNEKELREISYQYGVSAAQLVEIIQYSKYQFPVQQERSNHCQPCHQQASNLNPSKY